MKNKLVAIGLTLTLPILVHAKDVQVKVENEAYPAPAAMHFDIIQDEIASEAIKACGGLEAVDSLSEIVIRFQPGVGKLATISKKDSGFGSFLP